MRDPFKIDGPTCISFSMGRTSAYMLWRVLQAHGGLPADALICLANTGKEEEASLRFAQRIQQDWRVPINWLEYRSDEAGFAVVDYATASRHGEPFEAIIRKRSYLPNPVARFCTSELKIRPMHKFVRSLGWDEWDQFIGIRADEMRRVAKIRARGHSTETLVFCEYMDTVGQFKAAMEEAGVGCVSLVGADAPKKRMAAVDAFQQDPTVRVFIGTTNAAGVGITLTAANYVFFASLPWTPALKRQAEDRAYRSGNTRDVFVITPLVAGTIDEKIHQLLEAKKDIEASVIEANRKAVPA